MNLDIIKYRLFRVVTVFGCSLLPFSCVQDDDVACNSESTSDNVSLQLKVDAAGDNKGTAPTADEAKIHTLRVYAFAEIPQGDEDADKDGRLVGYYYTNSPATTAPFTFDMDIKFYKKSSQTVNFYVVANEGAMSTPAAEKPLTEKTTEQVLKEYTFTQINGPLGTKGLPMYYQSTVTLNKAATSSLQPFNLRRPIGKMEVFAAKPQGEATVLKITGLTLQESGTRARNYLMPQDEATLKSITSIAGDITIPVNADMVIEAMQNVDKTNPNNYKCIQQSPTYIFENPWGSNNWNVKGDDKGAVLKIDYSYGNEPRSGLVYLPPIQRNNYYAVYCLFHNEGKISVTCKVADWEHKLYPEMVFDYPTYSNPIQPYTNPDGWTEGQPYPTPKVYYSGDDNWEGSYSFRFNMSGPIGQHWKPTLYGYPEGFEVSVWQGNEQVPEETVGYPVSPNDYVIKVRATNPANKNKDVSLGISYKPAWSTEAQLLLINGLTDNLNWKGSEYAELIKIVQIERPTTK